MLMLRAKPLWTQPPAPTMLTTREGDGEEAHQLGGRALALTLQGSTWCNFSTDGFFTHKAGMPPPTSQGGKVRLT